jgi:hypothetical protein
MDKFTLEYTQAMVRELYNATMDTLNTLLPSERDLRAAIIAERRAYGVVLDNIRALLLEVNS